MQDSTAGLSFLTQSEGETKLTLRFHDEECKSFSDCSHEFPSSFSLKESLKEVVFPTYNDGEEVRSVHLLSITRSSYDERNQCPICVAVDIYRIKEGGDLLQSGCYIALFDVRTYNSQAFGEYFLTDELQLEKPLPHVKRTADTEQIQLLNDTIHQVILKSGHDVEYIHSLDMQVLHHELLVAKETSLENDDCDEFIGLDFS